MAVRNQLKVEVQVLQIDGYISNYVVYVGNVANVDYFPHVIFRSRTRTRSFI